MSKTLEGYLNWVKTCEQYESSTKNIWKLSDFDPKHSKSIELYKNYSTLFILYTKHFKKMIFKTQNFRKVFDFYPGYSILRKMWNFHPKHPKSIWFRLISSKIIEFVSKTLEFYRICTQTFEKYLISIQSMPKDILCFPKTFKKYRILIIDRKHSELSWSDFKLVWESTMFWSKLL